MTNNNMEDMEGLNDIWAHIINENLLNSHDNLKNLAELTKEKEELGNQTNTLMM